MPAALVDEPYPSCSYPTSSLRDEPYSPAPAHTLLRLPLPVVAPARPVLDPIYNCYQSAPAHEVYPGVRADGVLTAKHPLVDTFIAALPATSPRDGLRPAREAWWTKRLRAISVHDILGLPALSDRHAEAVFALAALKLLYQFHHPAHFTLWGRESGPRTARRVEKILYTSPSLVASPVGWAGTQEQLWLVHGLQKSIFAAAAHADDADGEAASNGMVLRKRKASAGAGGARPKRAREDAGSVLYDTASMSVIDDEPEADADGPRETRRSARQAHRQRDNDRDAHAHLEASTPTSPASHSRAHTNTRAAPLEMGADRNQDQAKTAGSLLPAGRRARSASSVGSAASSSATAVSESAGETCVEPDSVDAEAEVEARAKEEKVKVKGKGTRRNTKPRSAERSRGANTTVKAKREGRENNAGSHTSTTAQKTRATEAAVEEAEAELRVRTSTRVRRLAPKKAEALAAEMALAAAALEEEVLAGGVEGARRREGRARCIAV